MKLDDIKIGQEYLWCTHIIDKAYRRVRVEGFIKWPDKPDLDQAVVVLVDEENHPSSTSPQGSQQTILVREMDEL